MAKFFKDFTFANHRLSEYGNFISVDLNGGDSERMLGLEREMDSGSTNTYRIEPNYHGDKWSSALSFELHIIKNPCNYSNQKEMSFSNSELRQITRWLTSPHYPLWINFEYLPEDADNEIIYYKGWFNNIETYMVGGFVYGLKLYFTCTTSFGYTDYKIIDISNTSNTIINQIINNDSDELESYCYPQIKISPNSTGTMFMCNLMDCTILSNGTKGTSSLIELAEAYATQNWYEIKYTNSSPTLICDDTALQFYLIDKYGNDTKCTIFYLEESDTYYIVEDGFFYMNVKADLEVNMDCQRLLIQDGIGRMITYDELGITDVDHMYWMRLLNGNNTMLIYGDVSVTFKFRESRKVGE